MRQNSLGELGQHVTGTVKPLDSMGSKSPGRSYLRQLTLTPFLAHSTAKLEAICFTAALEALYGVWGYSGRTLSYVVNLWGKLVSYLGNIYDLEH